MQKQPAPALVDITLSRFGFSNIPGLWIFGLVIAVICGSGLAAQAARAEAPAKNVPGGAEPTVAAGKSPPEQREDEISLVIKGKIITVTDKEIVYRESGSTADVHVPLENLHFIRKATGEYRFFSSARTDLVNPTGIAHENLPEKRKHSERAFDGMQLHLMLGTGAQLANNNDTEAYISGLANYIAKNKSQSSGLAGYTGSLTSNAERIYLGGTVEPRIVADRFQLAINLGYAGLPKIEAAIASPTGVIVEKISLDGYFIPAFAIGYYRIPIKENLSLNLGLGVGVLYASIWYTETSGQSTVSQRYTGWNIAAIAKPELSYRIGRISLLLSTPFYLAESRKVESGSTALVNGDTGKVISPNLTGIGVSLAVGYQLY